MSEYYYLGTWDSSGKPNYLETSEFIDPDFVRRVRETLPNGQPVTTYNPHYLTNTQPRNIIIKTSEPEFDGADIYVTFIDEGAGYRNVFGYYVYDLNDNYIVPTKFVNDAWTPMTYADRNALDGNGKSILKKTIVFPNASLVGSGGLLQPGHRVKLLYDPANPSLKFPNNTGVGFFLIPNGWNGSTVYNANERVYSDNFFNNSVTSQDYIQTIIFYDGINSTMNMGELVLGFEDIMRPAGDRDFNDLVVKISYTPSYAYDTSNILFLSNGTPINDSRLVADKTGLYFNIPSSTVSSLLGQSLTNFKLQHKIKCYSHDHCNKLKQIYDALDLENEGIVEFGDDIDENSDPVSIKVTCKIPKNNIKTYNYFVLSIKNKTQISPLDPNIRNIVSYQDYYVNSGSYILDEIIDLCDYDNPAAPSLITKNAKPTLFDNELPYAMGDPHITTISGKHYMIPNTTDTYTLFNDGNLNIRSKLDFYPENKNSRLLKNLTFMRYVNIKLEDKEEEFIIDMFEPNTFYDKNLHKLEQLPSGYRLLTPDEYTFKFPDRINKFMHTYKNIVPHFQYIETNIPSLGTVTFEMIYAPQMRDYINSFGIVTNNILFSNAKGALISPYHIHNKVIESFC